MIRLLLALLLLCGSLHSAQAHPLAPALLEIEEQAPQDYALHWRRSPQSFAGAALWPELPAACRDIGEMQSSLDAVPALDSRWRVHCTFADWSGQTLRIAGLQHSGVEVIVRIGQHDGRRIETLIGGEQAALRLPTAQRTPSVFASYLRLGIAHLFGGFDHLLFVAGLVLLVRRPRALLWTATAFTCGHSLTLSLAALNLLRLPQALAELGIALSILLLANELLRTPAPQSPWQRRPWLMAAGFGLLHGLGFAGALAEVGLPQQAMLAALVSFNLGIELGQLAVIVGLLLVLRFWQRLSRVPATQALRALPAYAIGSLAAFWCWSRLLDLV